MLISMKMSVSIILANQLAIYKGIGLHLLRIILTKTIDGHTGTLGTLNVPS